MTSSRGFTLLEAMVAILVLGLAVVGTLQLLSGVAATTEKSRDYTRGRSLAASKLESLLSEDPATLRSRDGETGSFADPLSEFRYRLEVRPTGSGDLLTVQVRVWWERGARGAVTLATRTRTTDDGAGL